MGEDSIEELKRSLLDSSVRPMQEALDAEKITYRFLAKKLKRELNAKTTKWFQHEGMVIESYDIIDWGTRQRARIDAQKIMGVYAPEKHDLTINTPPEAHRGRAGILQRGSPETRGEGSQAWRRLNKR